MKFETKLKLVNSILMAGFMALLMSGSLSAINLGLTDRLVWNWGRSFLIAWPLAFVLSYLFGKRILTISQRLVERTPQDN